MRAFRDAGLPIVLLTNTTSRTRDRIAGTLADAGFPIGPDDVLTAPAAAAAHLREHRPDARCLLLNSGEDISADLDGVRLVAVRRRGPTWCWSAGPARSSTTPRWTTCSGTCSAVPSCSPCTATCTGGPTAGLQLDSGAFLLGLERAADTEAVVLGKPAGAFFAAALTTLGVAADEAVMVGDDLEADVLGAQEHGITGVLVRTGKFRPVDEDGVDGHRPQHVVDSIAELPGLLGLG